MACLTLDNSHQSLKSTALIQLSGCQGTEQVLQPRPPASGSVHFKETLGNAMDAAAQEGVSILIWLLQKRNGFLSFF